MSLKYISQTLSDTTSCRFSGKLTLEGGKPLNLSKEHVLLREMTVSGTNKVWGIVVYTGVDTKIQKNNAKANEAPTKVTCDCLL